MNDNLPLEVLALALNGAKPLGNLDYAARRLTGLARADSYQDWEPIERVFRGFPKNLLTTFKREVIREAFVCHDQERLGPALVVGRVKRWPRGTGWFAAVEGEVLRHEGRIPLFANELQAQTAAEMAAYSQQAQQAVALAIQVLRRTTEIFAGEDYPRQLEGVRMRALRFENRRAGSVYDTFHVAMMKLWGAHVTADAGSRFFQITIPIAVYASGPGVAALEPEAEAEGAMALVLILLKRIDDLSDSEYEPGGLFDKEWDATLAHMNALALWVSRGGRTGTGMAAPQPQPFSDGGAYAV